MKKQSLLPLSSLCRKSLLVLTAVLSAVSFQASAQTLTVKWRNAEIGATSNRDLAYNPVTGNLLLVKTTPAINLYKSTDGTANGSMSMTGVTGGTALYGIACTPDGTIFACNSLASGLLKIYMWENETAEPTNVASITVGTDTYGRGMSVFVRPGISTNLLFGGTGTTGYVLVNQGTNWTFKQLTGVSMQAMTGGGTFIDYGAPGFTGKFRFIAKARATGGLVYSFDPSANSPIALTGTAMTGNWVFQGNGITTHDYDPATGLIAATTSTLQGSGGSTNWFTNSIFSTTNAANLTGTPELSRIAFTGVGADGGNYGGTTWGTDGRVYANIAAISGGLIAYDIHAFVITAPVSATKVAGQSATFKAIFGGSALTYVWSKNGTPLSDDSKYAGTTSNTLTINDLISTDGDVYSVVATDANSGTATTSATLTIAASQAWTGGGADDNWTTAANWGGTALPTTGSTAAFGGSTRLTPLMDGSYDVLGLVFGPTAGAFTLNAASGSTLTLHGTVMNDSANLQTINLPVVLPSAQTVDIAAPVTISGVLSGSTTLTKTGAGTLTLSGTNTHTGAIAVSGGTLSVTNGSAIGNTSTVTLTTGGILSVDSAETIGSLAGSISSVILNAKLTIGGAGATYTGSSSGTNDLEIAVTGTETINSALAHTGKTILTSGTLSINDSSTLGIGTNALHFNGGTLFRAAQTTAQTFANPITVLANSTISGNPTTGARMLQFSAATMTSVTNSVLTVTNTATSGTGFLQFRITGTSANSSVPMALRNGVFGTVELILTNNATGVQVISGVISGNGKVIKQSTAAARQSTISGNNSYSGGLDILGGRVNLNNNNAAGTGIITVSNLTTIDIASTANGIVITNPVVLVGNANPNLYAGTGNGLELAGVISGGDGTSRLTRNNSGSGTVTLSGDNTFAGGVTVLSRTLALKHKNALGSGPLNIGDAAQTAASVAVTISSGADLTGANAIVNQVIVYTNFTVSAAAANPIEFTGGLSEGINDKGLTKTGTGVLILSGNNTYSGATTVSAGTLNVSGNLSPSPVTVALAATLTGAGSVGSSVIVAGVVSPGNGAGTLTTGDETWNGGGSYKWEMSDALGTAGANPGWDKIVVNGGLTIAANASSKFTINIASLADTVAGNAANFGDPSAQSWTILSASSGITGFDPAAFNIVTTGFSNSLNGAQFAITSTGTDLVLQLVYPAQNFTASGTAGAASFTGKPNTGYIIQYTDSLSTINWQTLTTVGTSGVITTSNTGVGAFADPGPLPAQRFYRIVLP